MCKKDVRWDIPQMESARWVRAQLLGIWLSAWLQNEQAIGYWVQFDSDGPYRRVEVIQELNEISNLPMKS